MSDGANDRFVLHNAHARGVTAVELWAIDPIGRTQVISVPIDALDAALDEGITVSVEALGDAFSGHGDELVIAPDPATFALISRAEGRGEGRGATEGDATARLICDLRELDGGPSPLCARTILKRTLGRATQLGSMFYVGATLQHHWFARDEPLLDQRLVRLLGRETARALEALGIAWRSHYLGTDGRFCLELDWVDPLTLADAIVTHRRVAHDLALDHAASATFAPFPWSTARSRLDLYVSLTRDGAPAFEDPLNPEGLAPAGRAFIGALQAELGALELVMRSTLHSYATPESPIVRRGSSARGDGGSTVLVQGADASANPYTFLAATLGLGGDADEAATYAEAAHEPAQTLLEAAHRATHSARLREILGTPMISSLSELRE